MGVTGELLSDGRVLIPAAFSFLGAAGASWMGVLTISLSARYWLAEAVTVTGIRRSTPEKEPERRLLSLRRAAGAKLAQRSLTGAAVPRFNGGSLLVAVWI